MEKPAVLEVDGKFLIKWFVIALIPGVVSQVLETTGAIDDARTSYFWPLTIILLLWSRC